MSDTIGLAAKFAGVVAGLTNPKLDGKGNYGSYTTLGELSNHLRAPCAAAGIAISQHLGGVPGTVEVSTFVFDVASGDSVAVGRVGMPCKDAQQLGAVTTYLRRFSLAAAFGIVGEPDDDGQTASGKTSHQMDAGRPHSETDGRTVARPTGKISAAQTKALQTRYSGWERVARLEHWSELIGRHVSSAKELTKQEAIVLLTEDDERLPV